jgi:aryl-alcohol dehydrogenase-like predicted oxidoreductase
MDATRVEGIGLGDSGVSATTVCLGTWGIGGADWGGADDDESVRTIRSALDRGVTFIDTAPAYGLGHSEEVVGRALDGYGSRDDVVIATKVGLDWGPDGHVFRDSSRRRILKEIDDSLRRLRTDHVDLYQVHWPDPLTPIEETAQAMSDLLAAGKVRAIGVSNYSPEQMDVFRGVAPLHSVQSPYNLFEREIERDVLPYAREHGITLLAYGSLCRGLLSGTMRADTRFSGDDLRLTDPKFQEPRYARYLAAVSDLGELARERHSRGVLHLAVRWILDQGAIALWGARHPGHLDPIAEVFGWSLSTADMDDIDELVRRDVPDPVGAEFMAPPARDGTGGGLL